MIFEMKAKHRNAPTTKNGFSWFDTAFSSAQGCLSTYLQALISVRMKRLILHVNMPITNPHPEQKSYEDASHA